MSANPEPAEVKNSHDHESEDEITTQAKPNWRDRLPDSMAWVKQLPYLRFGKEPDPDYELIDRKKLREHLKDVDPEIVKGIEDDLDFLNPELMRLFRQRDFTAKHQQNMYRKYQIGFMVLASLATIFGSLQALMMTGNPDVVPFVAFVETVIALFTIFLVTVIGREPPFPRWIMNRRRAEYLRREYFRFVMNLPPYNTISEGYERKLLLSQRAADINRGVYPDRQSQPGER